MFKYFEPNKIFSITSKAPKYVLLLFVIILTVGLIEALVLSPEDYKQSHSVRIMYVHVPAAWICLGIFSMITFLSVIGYIFKIRNFFLISKSLAPSGFVFSVIALVTGSIWGKPTWGVYWSWDPRLTTAAIMCIAYAGYLALRRFIDEPERRATWGAVTAIIVYADIPIVWFSVKWWNSLHQLQSNTSTMSPEMYQPMRISAFAFLFVMIALIQLRSAAIRRELDDELNPPLEPSLGGAQ